MGHPIRANRECSARCLLPTSNPAARAARAVPRPTNFSKRGASRRQTPISRLRNNSIDSALCELSCFSNFSLPILLRMATTAPSIAHWKAYLVEPRDFDAKKVWANTFKSMSPTGSKRWSCTYGAQSTLLASALPRHCSIRQPSLDRTLRFVSELATANSQSGLPKLFEHSSSERRRLKGAKLRCEFARPFISYPKPTTRS